MENEFIIKKLNYIGNYIIDNNKNKKKKEEEVKLNWTELKNNDIDLISREIIKNRKILNYNQTNLDSLYKKLLVAQVYLNMTLFTIILRYIEVVFKVKKGGYIFSVFSISTFYFTNKYFTKYICSNLLIEYSKIENKNPITILQEMKIKDSLVNKEARLFKLELNKYWKEPMAWH